MGSSCMGSIVLCPCLWELEQRLGLAHDGLPQRRSGDPGPVNRYAEPGDVRCDDVQLPKRSLHRAVQVLAVHDGLLDWKLRAHVPGERALQPRLLERPLPYVLRRGPVHRGLLERRVQHVVPQGRQLQHQLLGRGMLDGVRGGIDVHRRLLQRPLHPPVRGGREVQLPQLLE